MTATTTKLITLVQFVDSNDVTNQERLTAESAIARLTQTPESTGLDFTEFNNQKWFFHASYCQWQGGNQQRYRVVDPYTYQLLGVINMGTGDIEFKGERYTYTELNFIKAIINIVCGTDYPLDKNAI